MFGTLARSTISNADHRRSAGSTGLVRLAWAAALLLALFLTGFLVLSHSSAFAEEAPVAGEQLDSQVTPGNPGLDMQELEELGLLGLDEELDPQALSLVRLEGSNRYATMLSIVKQGFSRNRGGAIIVASGKNFPDALAASGLAGILDAPLILTDPEQLSTDALDAIQYLHATKAYVVGGPGAVSDFVFDSLREVIGGTSDDSVVRVFGDTRYETALEIYRTGCEEGAWSSTCIIATGENFADALSVSPVAYSQKMPIFLVSSEGLGEETLACIAEGGFSQAIIVGGTGVVSQEVEDALPGLLDEGTAVRLGGLNRYLTSSLIADYAVEQGYLSYNNFGLATGKNYPDALSGAALCGQKASVLLLVDPWGTQCLDQNIYVNRETLGTGYVFGGRGAVSNGLSAYVTKYVVTGLIPESMPDYVKAAVSYSLDDSIGYDSGVYSRHMNPDVDCSSFVYFSLIQGGVRGLSSWPFWTGSMRKELKNAGFTEYKWSDVKNSLQIGDILLNESWHTEIVYNPSAGLSVGALGDRDGKDGDSSGDEVSIHTGFISGPYASTDWQYVYRR